MYKIKKSELNALFAKIAESNGLYLPVKAAGKTNYAAWSDAAQVDLDTLKTVKSPKDAFFPQSENLYSCSREEGKLKLNPEKLQSEPFVLFGVRGCDLKGLDVLDQVFLSAPVDSYYAARREHGIIVTMACHAPETCTLCGDTQGEPLSHEWLPATCIAYETCALCGSTQGNLTGHTFTDTGCMTYAPCSVCGTYDGLEITHTWAEHRSVCTQCGRDERNADEHFIDAVGASLEARWSMIEADIAEVTAKENAAAEASGRKPKTIQPVFTRERMKEFTQAEYDQIIGHRGGSFENQAFIDWAEYYIDGVIVSLDEMDSLADTVHLVEQYARDGYHMQSVALYHLNEAIPVIVADEHQDELKTMLTNGEAIAKVSDLMANISFQPVSTTPDGRDRLEAIVTNNTGLHFASFSFDVNLFDKEGGYLATKTLTADNWEPGEKRSLSFYTVKNTYQMQMMFANWMFPGGETSDAQMGGDEAAEETEAAEEDEETEEAAG